MTSTRVTIPLTNAPAVTGIIVEDLHLAGRRFTDIELADGCIRRLVEVDTDVYADWKTYLRTLAA